MSPTPRALLCDYAEVISWPQPRDAVTDLAMLVDLDPGVFAQKYWQERPAYDQGCSAQRYWSAVTGNALSAHDTLLQRLIDADIQSWTHLNSEMIVLLNELHEQGRPMSLLSNAPRELADALRAHPAFGVFDHLFFSADLGLTKPNPAAFYRALHAMGRTASEILFVDDRADNVAAAVALGIDAYLYAGAEQLRRHLAQQV